MATNITSELITGFGGTAPVNSSSGSSSLSSSSSSSPSSSLSSSSSSSSSSSLSSSSPFSSSASASSLSGSLGSASPSPTSSLSLSSSSLSSVSVSSASPSSAVKSSAIVSSSTKSSSKTISSLSLASVSSSSQSPVSASSTQPGSASSLSISHASSSSSSGCSPVCDCSVCSNGAPGCWSFEAHPFVGDCCASEVSSSSSSISCASGTIPTKCCPCVPLVFNVLISDFYDNCPCIRNILVPVTYEGSFPSPTWTGLVEVGCGALSVTTFCDNRRGDTCDDFIFNATVILYNASETQICFEADSTYFAAASCNCNATGVDEAYITLSIAIADYQCNCTSSTTPSSSRTTTASGSGSPSSSTTLPRPSSSSRRPTSASSCSIGVTNDCCDCMTFECIQLTAPSGTCPCMSNCYPVNYQPATGNWFGTGNVGGYDYTATVTCIGGGCDGLLLQMQIFKGGRLCYDVTGDLPSACVCGGEGEPPLVIWQIHNLDPVCCYGCSSSSSSSSSSSQSSISDSGECAHFAGPWQLTYQGFCTWQSTSFTGSGLEAYEATLFIDDSFADPSTAVWTLRLRRYNSNGKVCCFLYYQGQQPSNCCESLILTVAATSKVVCPTYPTSIILYPSSPCVCPSSPSSSSKSSSSISSCSVGVTNDCCDCMTLTCVELITADGECPCLAKCYPVAYQPDTQDWRGSGTVDGYDYIARVYCIGGGCDGLILNLTITLGDIVCYDAEGDLPTACICGGEGEPPIVFWQIHDANPICCYRCSSSISSSSKSSFSSSSSISSCSIGVTNDCCDCMILNCIQLIAAEGNCPCMSNCYPVSYQPGTQDWRGTGNVGGYDYTARVYCIGGGCNGLILEMQIYKDNRLCYDVEGDLPSSCVCGGEGQPPVVTWQIHHLDPICCYGCSSSSASSISSSLSSCSVGVTNNCCNCMTLTCIELITADGECPCLAKCYPVAYQPDTQDWRGSGTIDGYDYTALVYCTNSGGCDGLILQMRITQGDIVCYDVEGDTPVACVCGGEGEPPIVFWQIHDANPICCYGCSSSKSSVSASSITSVSASSITTSSVSASSVSLSSVSSLSSSSSSSRSRRSRSSRSSRSKCKPFKSFTMGCQKSCTPVKSFIMGCQKACAPIKTFVMGCQKVCTPVKTFVMGCKKICTPIKSFLMGCQKVCTPVKTFVMGCQKVCTPVKTFVMGCKKVCKPIKSFLMACKRICKPIKTFVMGCKKICTPIKKFTMGCPYKVQCNVIFDFTTAIASSVAPCEGYNCSVILSPTPLGGTGCGIEFATHKKIYSVGSQYITCTVLTDSCNCLDPITPFLINGQMPPVFVNDGTRIIVEPIFKASCLVCKYIQTRCPLQITPLKLRKTNTGFKLAVNKNFAKMVKNVQSRQRNLRYKR